MGVGSVQDGVVSAFGVWRGGFGCDGCRGRVRGLFAGVAGSGPSGSGVAKRGSDVFPCSLTSSSEERETWAAKSLRDLSFGASASGVGFG